MRPLLSPRSLSLEKESGCLVSPEHWGGGRQCGALRASYLNSPLAVPPGDLVRSVAWEGDVLFSVNGLGVFSVAFVNWKKVFRTVSVVPLLKLQLYPLSSQPLEAGQRKGKYASCTMWTLTAPLPSQYLKRSAFRDLALPLKTPWESCLVSPGCSQSTPVPCLSSHSCPPPSCDSSLSFSSLFLALPNSMLSFP